MNFVTLMCYLVVGALSVALVWRLSRRWRQQLAYERALRHPALISAALWWTSELRRSASPDLTVAPTIERAMAITQFRVALMRELATARARDPEELYKDIGPGCTQSVFLSRAAAHARIDIDKHLSHDLRMRIRDHHVVVSRCGGTFWEPVWRES